jgi:hypothetical protein
MPLVSLNKLVSNPNAYVFQQVNLKAGTCFSQIVFDLVPNRRASLEDIFKVKDEFYPIKYKADLASLGRDRIIIKFNSYIRTSIECRNRLDLINGLGDPDLKSFYLYLLDVFKMNNVQINSSKEMYDFLNGV